MTISIAQLVVGNALLPRVVVFGSAVILVPWYVVCTIIATGGEIRAEERDRVVVVGDFDEGETVSRELADAPERPGQVVAVMRLDEAVGERAAKSRSSIGPSPTTRPCWCCPNIAHDEPRLVDQAAVLHESGLRVRSLSQFYEDWLGKLPIGELERVSLMFDIGEVHGARYAQVKRLLDIACGALGTLALLPVIVFVVVGNLLANRGPLFFRQDARRPRRPGVHDLEVPHDARASAASRPTSGRARTTRASRRSVASCAGPTSTSCRRW